MKVNSIVNRSITDLKSFESRDLPALAREHVETGPVAGWIDPCYYDRHFTPKIRGQITYLLHEKQIHAELGQTYVHVAMRLESQNAVQHESQWRIGIEPQTQSIVLHSIKIRRGDAEIEHASLARMQYLQREAGLERFVLQGSVTLLLLLEDVRPGDILEYSYTVSNRPRLMPEYLTGFFWLPAATEIGKCRFLIRHAEGRPVKWKASSEKMVPRITTDNGEVCCYWMDANFVSPDLEGGVPGWEVMFPWIQVSDCPSWGTIARAVLAEWEKQLPGASVAAMVDEIANFSPDPPARVTRAIELVQDEFRYLSVNLEMGGGIPATPEAVLRRRYGDCKDLAFLLVHLLRGLGVTARPVLVDSVMRKSVAPMLPSLQMFNHVVVEYEIGNEKRWVDCTLKNQGGGALNRSVADFGVGLPIDANTTQLAPVPKASLLPGTYNLRETFVLDTTGKASYLAVVVTATGAAADSIRTDFANVGIDGMAKDRLQGCANRFNRATRIKPLEYRDDRDANQFVFAEAFEIEHTLLTDQASGTCLFQIRSDLIASLMVNPGLAARRHPLALPHPGQWTHTVELEFAGLDSISVPVFQSGNQYFSFSRKTRSWPQMVKVVFSLQTLADSIPPAQVPEHRKHVEGIHEAAVVNLQLPLGYSRGRNRGGSFGALPSTGPSRQGASAPVVMRQKSGALNPPPNVLVSVADPEAVAAQKTAEVAGIAAPKPMPPATDGSRFQVAPEKRGSSQQRRARKPENRCTWAFFFCLLSLLAFIVALCAGGLGAHRLGGWISLEVMIPAWFCSMILAFLGSKQLSKYPGRYAESSKPLVTITFALGGLLGIFVISAILIVIVGGIDQIRGHDYQAAVSDEPQDFKGHYFLFHPPSAPWRQVEGRTIGSKAPLAFQRPEPMFFTIVEDRIEFMLLDPRQRVAELTKSGLRKSASSYQLLNEAEVTYNGRAGWQMESEVSLNGHDFYFVQWVYATNGIAFQLSAWAPTAEKSDLKKEAGRMFANFKLSTPQS